MNLAQETSTSAAHTQQTQSLRKKRETLFSADATHANIALRKSCKSLSAFRKHGNAGSTKTD